MGPALLKYLGRCTFQIIWQDRLPYLPNYVIPLQWGGIFFIAEFHVKYPLQLGRLGQVEGPHKHAQSWSNYTKVTIVATLFRTQTKMKHLQHTPLPVIAVTTIYIMLFSMVTASPIPGCPNPKSRSTAELHDMWSNHSSSSWHDSYFMVPHLTTLIQDRLKSTGTDLPPFGLEEDLECPDQPWNEPGVNRRSICPWYYIWNVDADRYPQYTAEARCYHCDECIGLDDDHRCEPAHYNILVLRKNPNECDSEGYFKYEAEYESISVGCTCAIVHSA